MGPSEITDEKSLQAWLETQPPDVAATIAHRAAMRAAPLFWQFAESYLSALGIPPIVSLRHLIHSQLATRSDLPPLPPVEDLEWMAKFATLANELAASEDIAAPSSSYVAILAASRSRDAASSAQTCSMAVEAQWLSADYVIDHPNAVAARQSEWSNIRADCAAQLQLSSVETGLSRRLWTASLSNSSDWKGVRQTWQASGPGWQFWIDWYEAALEGRPLLSDWDRHWDLLTDIALIPDADWTAGSDRVNGLIELIVEKHRLKAEAARLRAELIRHEAAYASVSHRSHNRPPELVEVPSIHEYWLVIGAVTEVEGELAKPAPSPSRLARIAETLLKWAGKTLTYCARLGDVALMEMAKGVGKVAAQGGVIWLLAQSEHAQTLAHAIMNLAARLPGGLP